MTNAIIAALALIATLALIAGGSSTASKGINPVQHSERQQQQTTQAASKGINPVQHSE